MEPSEKIIEKIENGQVKVNGVKQQRKKKSAKSEGEAHVAEDAKAGTETPDKRKRAKRDKPEAPVYPAETSINAHSFIRVPAKVMAALGFTKNVILANGKMGYPITKAQITGYDESTKTLSVQLA